MNQDYRGRVKRHLEAGGDPKYVNVKKKALARREESHDKALTKMAGKGNVLKGKNIEGKKDRHASHTKHTMCKTCNPAMFE